MTDIVSISIVFVFGIFLLCAVFGAGVAVFSSRVIRGVSGLAICSVGLSGMFYFLGFPFIALMEILIYIGAVCVTIAFAIMLAEPEETLADEKRDKERPGAAGWSALGLAAGAGLFAALVLLGTGHAWTAPAERVNDGSVEQLGIALLTTYSFPFEAISLLLLVAILGALAIARAGRKTAQ
ncbi:MAG: NADH-quinone oxidoreductase subunit J [bacterium]